MHTFRDFCSRFVSRKVRPSGKWKVTQFGSVGELVIWIKEAFEIFG
jgi:hypothetical protein